MTAIAIVSGGMDSVALAHLLAHEGHDLHLLSFDYGQRHKKELAFAARCAARLGGRHDIISLAAVTPFLTGSALTDDIPVPLGHYEDATMRATVVPNRNAMMLSVAVAVAVAEGAQVVATGVHAGDHAIYPDCRPAFIAAFDRMARIANEGFTAPGFRVIAPFAEITKMQIARIGQALAVPWAETWSCYQGGDIHCGRCGTCVERKEALAPYGDPTEYVA
jgi:7-cyano-7-deazaguanine synthase